MAKFETLFDCMLIWHESRDLSALWKNALANEAGAKYALSRLDCYIPGDTRPGKLESRGRNVRSILQGLRDTSSESLSPFALCLSVVHTRARAYAWHVHAWLTAFGTLPPISARIHLWFLVGVQGLRFHFNRAVERLSPTRAKSSRFRREVVSRNIRPSTSHHKYRLNIRLKLIKARHEKLSKLKFKCLP